MGEQAASTAQSLRGNLRSTESAAVAGILFALLAGTSLVLIQVSVPDDRVYDPAWVTERSREIGIAVALMPFAAIAFLWFIGVIREQVGTREDRFISTVFLGSGIVFLTLLLVWSGILGATLATAEQDPSWTATSGFTHTAALATVFGSVSMLRMAGVFMLSAGTLWLRTRAQPMWTVWFSYLLGLILLIGGGSLRPLRLAFPVWVLVVSITLLRSFFASRLARVAN